MSNRKPSSITQLGVIYKVTNKLNKKAYIGQAVIMSKHETPRSAREARWSAHLRSARSGSKYAIHRAIRKYGAENFTVRTLKVVTFPLLNAAEIHFIARHGTFGPGGYNMTRGGDGVYGTPDVCRRISVGVKAAYAANPALAVQIGIATSAALTGRKQPAKVVAKRAASLRKLYATDASAGKRMSQAQLDQYQRNPMSRATRKKISKSHMGLMHTPASIEKMGRSLSSAWSTKTPKARQAWIDAIQAGRAKSAKCSAEACRNRALKSWKVPGRFDETLSALAEARGSLKRNNNGQYVKAK